MILVVEDEPGILDFLERGLGRLGFDVRTASDGRSGLERALEPGIELVVLDLMLPELSGSEVLAELQRQRPGLPVIVLTARGEVEDRVSGLNAGAADYMAKPFSLDELGARISAQLRQASHGEMALERSGIKADLISRQVTVGDVRVQLSTTEFELLVYLMRNPGKVLSRATILAAVWGYNHDPGTNVLDVYVGYLRRKLGAAGVDRCIVTVRSMGYRFDEVNR